MSIAAAVLSGALAAVLTFAAVRKLSHRPEVVASYARVGVPEERLDHLAYVLLAGAAGLVVGIAWTPLGIAAAIGVVVYFALAIAAHVRFDDLANVPTPIGIELVAVAALALLIASR